LVEYANWFCPESLVRGTGQTGNPHGAGVSRYWHAS